MRKTTSKAFSLTELLVVVALIAVFSIFAVPAYKDFTTRNKLQEAFAMAEEIKQAQSRFYAKWGRFPNSTSEVNFLGAGKGKYVEQFAFYGCTEDFSDRFVAYFKSDPALGWLSGKDVVFRLEAKASSGGQEGDIVIRCRPGSFSVDIADKLPKWCDADASTWGACGVIAGPQF